VLDTATKRRIDTARDILVGKVPDPKSQVEQITIALIYKFMDDMDTDSEELGDKTPGPFAAISGRFVQRVPRSLHAQRIAYAKAEGVSLNTLIVSLVSQGLGSRHEVPATPRRLTTRSTRTARKRPAG